MPAIDTAAALAEVEQEIADAENGQSLDDVEDKENLDDADIHPDADDDEPEAGGEGGGDKGNVETPPAENADDKGKEKGGDDASKNTDNGNAAPADAAPADEPLEDDDGLTLADGSVASRDEELAKRERAIETQLDELEKKLADGEFSQSDYAREARKLNRELADVISDRKAEAMRVASDQKAFVREWSRTQRAFFREHPEFDASKNPTLHRALDAEIRAVSTDEKNHKLTLKQLMETGRRNVVKAFGLAPGKAATEAEPEKAGDKNLSDQSKPAKTDKQPAAKPTPKLPPSVDDIPGVGEGTDGEFAFIDKLKGNARTAAFAKLTPEQQDRYLDGQ